MKKISILAACFSVLILSAQAQTKTDHKITKNQEDTSWTLDNEGYRLIRNLSNLLWNYYEPKSGWKPASGMEKYRD